jgi:Protein of unknown function (DUF3810)
MKRWLVIPKALALPLAVAAVELAFFFSNVTERVYAERIYPGVVRFFAAVNRAPFSWAEVLFIPAIALAITVFVRAFRSAPRGRRTLRMVSLSWTLAGAILWMFLVLWGFNYARPSLETRFFREAALREPGGLRLPEALLDTGRRVASHTGSLFTELEVASGPTALPMSFEELDRAIDEGYRKLRLPGDAITFRTAPAKPLESSTIFSYLGISGIYVPFTGEPSVNALQPDAALPLALAHEKAHQRGITNEGEANFAAFLVCSRQEAPPYLRYAAYLFATEYLLGEASARSPREEVASAWDLAGAGPKTDVRALMEFWRRYQGRTSEIASGVNDTYLRALRVPEGVESYGTVVRMLLALDERGELVPGS